MIDMKVAGSYLWRTTPASFPDYDQLPLAVWYNGSVYMRQNPGQMQTLVVGTTGSLIRSMSSMYPLFSFQFGSVNFIAFGSHYGATGGTTYFSLTNGTHEWKTPLAIADGSGYPTPTIIAANAAITGYGIVFGLTVSKSSTSQSYWHYLVGFDGVSLRQIGSYLSAVSYGTPIQAAQMLFALGNKVFAIGGDAQQTALIRAYLIDTITWQSVRVESYFQALSNNLQSLTGGLSSFRQFFSGGVNASFDDVAYFTFPAPSADSVASIVYEARPRADGIASLRAMEFALPIDFYWTAVTPAGVFISNKDTIYAAHPVSGVEAIIAANLLGMERFVSPLTFNALNNRLYLVGYKTNQHGSSYLYFFVGSFTVQFQTQMETNLISPIAGTIVGYPQFVFRPTASDTPAEFELLVESKDKFFARMFASWSSRVGWEYSQDGTSFIRMTGPIIANGTTIMRFTPPSSLPPGNYRWSVKKIMIGS